MNDMVNSPAHYLQKEGDIECIDAMIQVFGIEAVEQYARINSFKYVWRHRYKHPEDPKIDRAKGLWYFRFGEGDDPRNDK